jgi:hypothetical protein
VSTVEHQMTVYPLMLPLLDPTAFWLTTYLSVCRVYGISTELTASLATNSNGGGRITQEPREMTR